MVETSTVPGKAWYAAAVLVVLGTIAAVVGLVAWFVLNLDTGAQFIGPGRHVVEFDKPGTYVVWNDYRTVFRGRSYDVSENLPSGVAVQVRDVASGQTLEVAPSHGASSSVGNTARKSVAKFEIKIPGRYEIVIDGDFPQRVFSASRDFLLKLFAVIFGAIAILMLGFGTAIGLVCWVFIKRERAREAAAPAASRLAGSGGQAPSTAAIPADPATKPLKDIARIVYILQLLSLMFGVTFIAAIIINYVKREEVQGTWLESHFRWQIHTFWWCLLWAGVGIATAMIIVGFFVLMVSAIWMLYRAVKGLLNLEENKPMPV